MQTLRIDVCTNWPSPVRSRWRSAWTTAAAEMIPLPVSPYAVICQIGGVPWCVPPASYAVPARAWPIWSLPGSGVRGPSRSKPRVWQ